MKISLKEKSYNYIKEKIVTCQYMPGHFLDEKELINEIGASRTPIREALNKLEQENLLLILPKKGVMVTDVTAQHVIDIHELRLTLEPQIIIKFSYLIDIDIINKFLEDLEIIDNNNDLNTYDAQLHDYFISLYNNQYVNLIFNSMRSQQSRIRKLTTMTTACFNETITEHKNILVAIINKNYEESSKYYETHIINSKQRTLESLLKMKL
ncbi:MAG: GntR family transcriptional regulator [Lachnospirales bacterium]